MRLIEQVGNQQRLAETVIRGIQRFSQHRAERLLASAAPAHNKKRPAKRATRRNCPLSVMGPPR